MHTHSGSINVVIWAEGVIVHGSGRIVDGDGGLAFGSILCPGVILDLDLTTIGVGCWLFGVALLDEVDRLVVCVLVRRLGDIAI